jgi:hypothetical protein
VGAILLIYGWWQGQVESAKWTPVMDHPPWKK